MVSLNDIDSDDLEIITLGPGYLKELVLSKEQIRILKDKAKLLKGKISGGNFFDWEETDGLLRYVIKNKKNYPYIYNATPDADGVLVVFSKVRLPKAKKI